MTLPTPIGFNGWELQDPEKNLKTSFGRRENQQGEEGKEREKSPRWS